MFFKIRLHPCNQQVSVLQIFTNLNQRKNGKNVIFRTTSIDIYQIILLYLCIKKTL